MRTSPAHSFACGVNSNSVCAVKSMCCCLRPTKLGLLCSERCCGRNRKRRKPGRSLKLIKLITRRAQKIPVIGKRCVVEVITCGRRIPNLFGQIRRRIFKLHTSRARADDGKLIFPAHGHKKRLTPKVVVITAIRTHRQQDHPPFAVLRFNQIGMTRANDRIIQSQDDDASEWDCHDTFRTVPQYFYCGRSSPHDDAPSRLRQSAGNNIH